MKLAADKVYRTKATFANDAHFSEVVEITCLLGQVGVHGSAHLSHIIELLALNLHEVGANAPVTCKVLRHIHGGKIFLTLLCPLLLSLDICLDLQLFLLDRLLNASSVVLHFALIEFLALPHRLLLYDATSFIHVRVNVLFFAGFVVTSIVNSLRLLHLLLIRII